MERIIFIEEIYISFFLSLDKSYLLIILLLKDCNSD